MGTLLLWVARIAGVAGALLLATAIGSRLYGLYWIGGVQVGSLLHTGTAMLALAAVCYLARLVERPPGR